MIVDIFYCKQTNFSLFSAFNYLFYLAMYVEELIIDGFKSYAARTHITGWDHEFNAITGLNGSGKSNILDAICFVLGLRNYKLVSRTR